METALVRPALEQDSLPAAHGRQGRGTWLRRLQGAGYAGGDVQIADPSPNNWFSEAPFKTAPSDRLRFTDRPQYALENERWQLLVSEW